MKKPLLALLTICLLMRLALPVHASEINPDVTAREQQEETQVHEPTQEEQQPEDQQEPQDSPMIVSTWEELQAAVNTAEDGDTITLADCFIQIPNGATLGSSDKHIIIQLSNLYADKYKDSPLLVFNMGEHAANIQNITFSGNDIPANNLIMLCCDTTPSGCSFMNCKTTFDTSCIRTADVKVNITDCLFSNNYGTGGGAIDIGQCGNVEIENCQFINNFGLQGGVIHNNGKVKFDTNYFKDNISEYGGQIVYSYGEIEIDLNMEE